MSKVSTRPQKVATPVTVAATAVAAPGSTPPALPEEWRTAAAESRDVVMSLVQEVMSNEASRVNNCGRVDRLLGFVRDGFGRVQNDAKKDDFETHAFDAEALLAGAMKILEAENGNALDQLKLRHAFQILDKLTDALMGDEIYPVWDAIRYTPKVTAPSRNPLNGLASRQVELILNEIATKASTLGSFLRSTRDDVHEVTPGEMFTSLDMAVVMTELLGMLADIPAGVAIVGNAADWILGPNFAVLGKAVAA